MKKGIYLITVVTGGPELFKKHVTFELVPETRVSRWSLDRGGERKATPERGDR